MSYAEKLTDPRWQKKRLEVFERAGWKCEFCGREDSTLHVHHLNYTGEPWEAPFEDLEALCAEHHRCRKTVMSIDFSPVRAATFKRLCVALESAYERGVTVNDRIEAMIRGLQ